MTPEWITSSEDGTDLPALTARDERNIQKDLESIFNDIMRDEKSMSDEDRELLRISLESTMRLAKQMAKQKFTPKKYRK